jgi:hypothetical protein
MSARAESVRVSEESTATASVSRGSPRPPGPHLAAPLTRPVVALALGLALVAVALVLTLSGSPLVVAYTNAAPANEPLLEATSALGACQGGEVLSAHISAIRLTLVTAAGPRVSVTALSGGRVLTSGTVGSGWTSGAVTIPVRPVPRAVAGVRICFDLGPPVEAVAVGGSRTSPTVGGAKTATAGRESAATSGGSSAATERDGRPLAGRFTVEYMRRGRGSWWSLAQTVARHMGLGRAPAGTWVVLALAAAMGVAIAAASWLAVRELRR